MTSLLGIISKIDDGVVNMDMDGNQSSDSNHHQGVGNPPLGSSSKNGGWGGGPILKEEVRILSLA